MWIGAYFSKPDWHSPDYRWPQFPPFDRNVNYDPEKYPERWNSFVESTHNQIMELCTDYGKMDLFWFDGGWVQKNGTASYRVEDGAIVGKTSAVPRHGLLFSKEKYGDFSVRFEF